MPKQSRTAHNSSGLALKGRVGGRRGHELHIEERELLQKGFSVAAIAGPARFGVSQAVHACTCVRC